MQLVLSGYRVVAHGENFIAMGGTVVNTETNKTYQRATIVECDGCPSDIGEVGYEYHAGVFVPCAPYGKGKGNVAVLCDDGCKAVKDSGVPFVGLFTPRIIVSAPTGSTVTCTDGEVVLSVDEVDGTWTFDLPSYGEWVVQRVGSADVAVNVDEVKIYKMFLFDQVVNYTMLYYYGDECTEVTGGITTAASGGKGSISKGTGSITGSMNGITTGATNYISLYTKNPIDLAGYSVLSARRKLVFTNAIIQKMGVYNSTTEVSISPAGTYNDFVKLNMSNQTASQLEYHLRNNWGGTSFELTFFSWFLAKADDWNGLAKFAGISASSMSDLLTKSTTLLSTEDTVRYLVYNCTGTLMLEAIQSSAFLSALNSSPYKEMVYANEHWAKFLAMVA